MTEWAGNGKFPTALILATLTDNTGIISYYLAPILDLVSISSPQHQIAINLGLQVWNTLWASTGALACERLGCVVCGSFRSHPCFCVSLSPLISLP